MGKLLHIISFDNPSPANYGGVIDVFYKIKALHETGFEIYLHSFFSERNLVSEELKAITKEVFLYKKNRNPIFLFSKIPFGVISRFDNKLTENIKKIDAPILFEGLQTTMILHKTKLKNQKFLRLHNVESNFYSGMSKSEQSLLKKVLYYFEAKKYASFEKQVSTFNHVFTLSIDENKYISQFAKNPTYIPVFSGNSIVENLSGFGNYAMYHGDLRLPDNIKSVTFLIEIFKKLPQHKFIIASSNGENIISSLIKNYSNIEFQIIKNNEHLNELLANAHCNILWSFQKSGTKLKLINSLFKSRFCIINENMIDDKRVIDLCELTDETHLKEKIIQIMAKPYDGFIEKEKVLSQVYNDLINAQMIKSLMMQ